MIKTKIISISRHRICIDGEGVTTLVIFHGCTLSCKYCLNPLSISPNKTGKEFTPEELYSEVNKDNIYFLATKGGITFGGGEPVLRFRFIKDFRHLCNKHWRINIETALNVPTEYVNHLLPVIDQWIVDIKDLNNEIYQAYTGKSNTQVIENLKLLIGYKRNHKECKIKVRVPNIPGYNNETDIEKSIETLNAMGLTNIEKFEYITDEQFRYGTWKSNM